MPSSKEALDLDALEFKASVLVALRLLELARVHAAKDEVTVAQELEQARVLIVNADVAPNPRFRLSQACDVLRDAVVIVSSTVPLTGRPGANPLVSLVIDAHAHTLFAAQRAPDGVHRNGRKL